jgi:hypothetical protein
MALRGDDFIGVRVNEDDNLYLLKGEAKSRETLGKTAINEARKALSRGDERPTPTSLLFVAHRLMERDGAEATLGRMIRNQVGSRTIPASRIEHAMFTMSGNDTAQALIDDLNAASADRTHTVIHLMIEDHQDFI